MSGEQRRVIKQAARSCFGADAEVRLFGSRVDDSKRGEDIDLLINTSLTDPDTIGRAEIAFQVQVQVQVQVQRALGEQRTGVLLDYPGRRVRPPIFAIAERTGIRL